MKYFLNKNKGFTLIELLVVVSIISLLSSIVLASIQDARARAKGTAFRQEVNQLILAFELIRSDNNGNYPEDGYLLRVQNGPVRQESLDFNKYLSEFPNPPFPGTIILNIDPETYSNPCVVI